MLISWVVDYNREKRRESFCLINVLARAKCTLFVHIIQLTKQMVSSRDSFEVVEKVTTFFRLKTDLYRFGESL